MFGQPVHVLMQTLPAVEFDAWKVYRNTRGFAGRHSMLLLARIAHGYFSVNKAKDNAAPAFSDFYPPAAKADAPASAESGTSKDIAAQQIAALQNFRKPRR